MAKPNQAEVQRVFPDMQQLCDVGQEALVPPGPALSRERASGGAMRCVSGEASRLSQCPLRRLLARYCRASRCLLRRVRRRGTGAGQPRQALQIPWPSRHRTERGRSFALEPKHHHYKGFFSPPLPSSICLGFNSLLAHLSRAIKHVRGEPRD